jgi:hypothetical protein
MPEGKPIKGSKLSLLDKLAAELERGSRLIASVDDAAYRWTSEITGSVGAHFRHNLDAANRFLEGIGSRRIDYGNRERDARIESDRSYAIERYSDAVRRILSLPAGVIFASVSVRSEVDASAWLPSSVGREVEYVHSHTVHHHALIAEKLSAAGIKLDKDFGVAPSTLEYWAAKKG